MLICCAETSCAFFVFSSNRKILCHPCNYDLASNSFKRAIDEIDKSIDHLQKTKDALLGTDRNLRLANDKPEVVATAWGLFGKHAAYSPLFMR